ncbi:MAG: DNA repair protein RadC [Anaerolineae bacterium]|nr:DNA repair protein RadC [Candidatus Roseilinea sp.]MDW8449485.1 DNA repair protein RadC [Anaerolineae bacterium]
MSDASMRPSPSNAKAAEAGSRPEYRTRICDIPEGERPRERFREIGATGMSQRELLAIILRSGAEGVSALRLAEDVLMKFGGLSGVARASLDELQQVHGIGPVKAIEIKAALELGRRLALSTQDTRPQVKTPADAAQLLMLSMGLLEQEEVRTMLLDTRNRVLGAPMIYRGSVNAASMRVGEVFREAIRSNCASIIVAHNHPSGDPSPSAEDIAVTRALVQAGKLLDIEVLDHIIIAHNRYVSLKERGLGFE